MNYDRSRRNFLRSGALAVTAISTAGAVSAAAQDFTMEGQPTAIKPQRSPTTQPLASNCMPPEPSTLPKTRTMIFAASLTTASGLASRSSLPEILRRRHCRVSRNL